MDMEAVGAVPEGVACLVRGRHDAVVDRLPDAARVLKVDRLVEHRGRERTIRVRVRIRCGGPPTGQLSRTYSQVTAVELRRPSFLENCGARPTLARPSDQCQARDRTKQQRRKPRPLEREQRATVPAIPTHNLSPGDPETFCW